MTTSNRTASPHRNATATGPFIEQHRAIDMRVDESVQRHLIDRRADTLSGNYDPRYAGVLTGSMRADGTLVIIDGQHRRAAAIKAGRGNDLMTVNVYYGLNRQGEAGLFVALNDSRKLTAFDAYDKSVKAGDAVCVAIDSIVRSHGLRVQGASDAAGTIRAVGSLQTSYRLGKVPGQALDRALATIVHAWGRDASGFDGHLVHGLSRVYAAYEDIDQASLVSKLAAYPGGSVRLVGVARERRDLLKGSLPMNVARLLVDAYNARRRKGQLPPL